MASWLWSVRCHMDAMDQNHMNCANRCAHNDSQGRETGKNLKLFNRSLEYAPVSSSQVLSLCEWMQTCRSQTPAQPVIILAAISLSSHIIRVFFLWKQVNLCCENKKPDLEIICWKWLVFHEEPWRRPSTLELTIADVDPCEKMQPGRFSWNEENWWWLFPPSERPGVISVHVCLTEVQSAALWSWRLSLNQLLQMTRRHLCVLACSAPTVPQA